MTTTYTNWEDVWGDVGFLDMWASSSALAPGVNVGLAHNLIPSNRAGTGRTNRVQPNAALALARLRAIQQDEQDIIAILEAAADKLH